MSETTKIEWCDSTFNPWEGCTKVGPGCDHCYAEARNHRFGGGNWGPGAPRRRTSADNWQNPIRWNRAHEKFYAEHGRRRRVFCASLADWLDNEVPIEWLVDLLDLIRQTPNLDWLLLTKRIGNWLCRLELAAFHLRHDISRNDRRQATLEWIQEWLDGEAPANVWLGSTVVNQIEADRDIPKLLATPAVVRFLSMEPLLGAVDLRKWIGSAPVFPGASTHLSPDGYERQDIGGGILDGIDWIIAGGESGHKARPMEPDWVRSLRDQCAATDTPFLFKQWGEWGPNWLNDNHGNKIEGTEWVERLGIKITGRLLDGKTHNGFPACPALLVEGYA